MEILLKHVRHLSDRTKGKVPSGKKRSGRWGSVRLAFLEINPTCAVCGGSEKLEVHHKQPFYLNPELELDHSNLITLCESNKNGVNCHLLVGHLGCYTSFNINVDEDARKWNEKLKSRPTRGTKSSEGDGDAGGL